MTLKAAAMPIENNRLNQLFHDNVNFSLSSKDELRLAICGHPNKGLRIFPRPLA
jgi:hypothetical protein